MEFVPFWSISVLLHPLRFTKLYDTIIQLNFVSKALHGKSRSSFASPRCIGQVNID